MSEDQPRPGDALTPGRTPDVHAVVEISVRIGVLFLLVGVCLLILAPFAGIVVWALIIAIAAEDLFRRLALVLGGRQRFAATLLVVLALMLLIVPAVLLSETLIGGAQRFQADLADGKIDIPPPSEKVAALPLVGAQIFEAWTHASDNLADALARLRPQLEAVSRWLLVAAGSAGVALLQLTASFVLAGVLLTRSEQRRAAIAQFATRLSETQGPALAELASATVKSVVQGILGVAAIQTILAGLGFIVAGVPAAGLWALLVLVAAVVQVPVALVMVPPVLLVISQSGAATSAVFTLWCVAVSLIDNVLKPILFARGVHVPSLVIFIGAIGGLLAMGIVGLFLGAVVLALGYELFITWLRDGEDAPASSP